MRSMKLQCVDVGCFLHPRHWGLALMVFMFLGGVALAADPVELMIKNGVELRRQGKDAQALTKFREAYALSKTSRAAAQLGLCEQSLKMWEESEGHLSEALVGQSDQWISRNTKTLEAARTQVRKHLVTVTFKVSPADTSVKLNGTPVGSLAQESNLYVREGDLTAVFERQGYEPQTVKKQGKAGETIVVEAYLMAVQELAPKPLALQQTNTPESASQTDELQVSRAADNEKGTSSRPARVTAAWVASGVGAALLVGGLTFHLLANSKYDDFNSYMAPNDAGQCARQLPEAGGGDCNSLLSSADSRKNLAIVGYVGGGLAVATAAALFLWPSGSSETQVAACLPTTNKVGAVCSFRF